MNVEELVEMFGNDGKKDIAQSMLEYSHGDEEHVETAIQVCEKTGTYFGAAIIAEKAGNYERAIINYQKAGWYISATNLTKKLGQLERTVEIYEKAGKHYSAATFAEKSGLYERAAENYIKSGSEKFANEMYQKITKPISFTEMGKDLLKTVTDVGKRVFIKENLLNPEYAN